jgi:type II secretory pathway pseudopilin PulG
MSSPESTAAWQAYAEPSLLLLAVTGLLMFVVAALLPLLIIRRRCLWVWVTFAFGSVGLFALLLRDGVWEVYADTLSLLGFCLLAGAVYSPLLLWRRTRRLGLVLVGAALLGSLALANYYMHVICVIGYILLLVALWPRWRLLLPVSAAGNGDAPVPPRGVLRARSSTGCHRPGMDGFTLIGSLVGVFCLVIGAGLVAQMIASSMRAVRRAEHNAVAMDLLESAREWEMLGSESVTVQSDAARLLPQGDISVTRSPAEHGLTRVSATATWRETDGTPGRTSLDWLIAEGPT